MTVSTACTTQGQGVLRTHSTETHARHGTRKFSNSVLKGLNLWNPGPFHHLKIPTIFPYWYGEKFLNRVLISSTAQAYRRNRPIQATPCAAVSNHDGRMLVNYAPESGSVTTGCIHKIHTEPHTGVRARTCLTACCHYSDILPENWSTLFQFLHFTSTQ